MPQFPRRPLLAGQPGHLNDPAEVASHVACFERSAGTGCEHQAGTPRHLRMSTRPCVPQRLERVDSSLRKRQCAPSLPWSWCRRPHGQSGRAPCLVVSTDRLPAGQPGLYHVGIRTLICLSCITEISQPATIIFFGMSETGLGRGFICKFSACYCKAIGGVSNMLICADS